MTEGLLGPFRKVDPGVVDDDPFWSVVRRRHPDLTLVLVPEDPGAGVDEAEDRSAATADPARERSLLAAWSLIEPLLAARVEATDPPSRRTTPAGDIVLEQALRGLGMEGGVDLLRDVALTLGRQGWELRPSTVGECPLLEARQGGVHLRAEAGSGATVLAVTSWV